MEIKLLQKELLNMMKNFHQACVSHKLKYYMLGGTCLGAIRHKGFIPWDDDMDVGMPRCYYNRFIENAQAILPSQFELRFYKNTPKSPFHFVKLINKETTLVENLYTNYVEGVYIDVFPLDYMETNSYWEYKRFKWIKHLHSLIIKHACTMKPFFTKEKILTKVAKMVPLNVLHASLELLMTKNNNENSSSYCNFLGAWGEREIVSQSIFGQPVLYKFEDCEFYGPEKYDEYLKSLYGDYMQPPPEKERVLRHNYYYVNLNMPYREYIKE